MIVFMRAAFIIGDGHDAVIFDTSTETTELVSVVEKNSKFAHYTTPGKHIFMVASEAADFMEATLSPGKTYYVLVTPRPGIMETRFSFRPLRQSDLAGSDFEEWNDKSKYVELPPEAREWAAASVSEIRERREKWWPQWQSKPEHQRASQTLNPDDSR